MRGEEKKSSPKQTLDEGGKKQGQPELTILVSPQTGRDEKGIPVSAPSIDIGPLVGAGSPWPCYLVQSFWYFIDNIEEGCPNQQEMK